VLEGTVDVNGFAAVGERASVFDGPPAAVYVPWGTPCEVVAHGAGAEVGVCAAPGGGAHVPLRVDPGDVVAEARGTGAMARTVHPILMTDRPAHSLLVVEVVTPGGHWSSFPPHKHDRDDPPRETLLEETYYHRVDPPQGFGLQRVYGNGLDETITFGDRDIVLVPHGYHTVAMPPGYDGYYLNVMAGPLREWAVADDPRHAWLRTW
jgi:5-deoxy-glucuronate isomerase